MRDEAIVKRSETVGYANAVAAVRGLPGGESIIRDNYLYEDARFALQQFCSSDEWRSTVAVLRPKSGDRVLDYGAGRCLASIAFSMLGCRVTALDMNISPEVGLGVLGIGQVFSQHKLTVAAIAGDGEHIPFKAESFNHVYCRQALHHAYDLPTLAVNLVRVLAPGGKMLAYGEHRRPIWSTDEQFRQIHPAVKFGANEHSYLESEYRRIFLRAGLRSVAIIPIWPRRSGRSLNRLMHGLGDIPVVGKGINHWYDRVRHYRAIGSQVVLVGEK